MWIVLILLSLTINEFEHYLYKMCQIILLRESKLILLGNDILVKHHLQYLIQFDFKLQRVVLLDFSDNLW